MGNKGTQYLGVTLGVDSLLTKSKLNEVPEEPSAEAIQGK